jgi:D-3-phosphoglycerate dehydrogenase
MTPYEFILATGTWTDADVEREHLADLPATVRAASLATAEEVASETRHAHGIIVSWNPLPRELVEHLGPNVRIVARAGIGLDSIDLEAARERGIAVLHTPDYATDEVATHAVALLLALARRIVDANALARRDWMAWKELGRVMPLHQQTVGVLGCGRIGRATIARLLPLVGQVLVYDPYIGEVPAGAENAESLDHLLRRSHFVMLHMPLTKETRGIIGERELGLLMPGAMIVNVSRGPLIDESALVRALHEGRVAGAALDVLEQEPPPPDAPILSAPNVILSPHFAWYSVGSERRARIMSIDGMIDYLEGRPLRGGRLAVDPRAAPD